MSLLLVLLPYALAYVAVATWRVYNRTPSAGESRGDDLLHSSRLPVLKLVTFAHVALLAVAVISAGAGRDVPSVLAAVAPLLTDLGVLLSLRASNTPKWFWAQAAAAAIAIVAWPTILLAQSQTAERFAGALTGHVVAALLLEVLSCPPVLSLPLAVGSLALPLVMLLTNRVALPDPAMEVGSLLFLPLVIMLLGVGHYVHNVHQLLHAACACIKELDTENTESQSYLAALQVQTGFVTFLASQLSAPLKSLSDCLEIIKDLAVGRQEVDIYETLMVLNYQATSYLATVVSFGRVSSVFPFDIRQLVEDVVESVKEAAAEAGLRIVQYTSDLVSKIAVGSAGLIKEVLLRLLKCAITLSGGDTVTVVASSALLGRTLTPRCAELSLRVQDNGQGLSEERLRALSESVNGLAAGGSEIDKDNENVDLLVCSQIVSGMAGTFGVTTSEPGQGTAYDVKLSLPHWDEADLLSKLERMTSISWNASESKRSLASLSQSNSRFIQAWQDSVSSQLSRVPSVNVVMKQSSHGQFPKTLLGAQSGSPREVRILQIKHKHSSSFPLLKPLHFRALKDDGPWPLKAESHVASLDVTWPSQDARGSPSTKVHSFPIDWAKRARQTEGSSEGIKPAASSDSQPKDVAHPQSTLRVMTASCLSGSVVFPSDPALDSDVEALRLQRLRALYVDEDAVNRLRMTTVLESLGLCHVRAADGFEAALQAVAEAPDVQVVVTNHPDPQATLEFAQAVRQGVPSKLYILALTGRLDHHLVETFRSFPEETINRFALKPLSRAYFTHLLTRFFAPAPSPSRSPFPSPPKIVLQ